MYEYEWFKIQFRFNCMYTFTVKWIYQASCIEHHVSRLETRDLRDSCLQQEIMCCCSLRILFFSDFLRFMNFFYGNERCVWFALFVFLFNSNVCVWNNLSLRNELLLSPFFPAYQFSHCIFKFIFRFIIQYILVFEWQPFNRYQQNFIIFFTIVPSMAPSFSFYPFRHNSLFFFRRSIDIDLSIIDIFSFLFFSIVWFEDKIYKKKKNQSTFRIQNDNGHWLFDSIWVISYIFKVVIALRV